MKAYIQKRAFLFGPPHASLKQISSVAVDEGFSRHKIISFEPMDAKDSDHMYTTPFSFEQ